MIRPDLIEFMQRLQALFDAIPVPTKMADPIGDEQLPTLLVGFDSVGENKSFVQFEFVFLTNKNIALPENIAIMQTFAVLHRSVQEAALPGLHWLIHQINPFLTLGFFGIMEENRTLFLKANNLFTGSLSANHPLEMIDKQTGVLFYQINLFYDMLCAVAEGKVDARDAWAKYQGQ